ncbi:MAG: Zn-ribbon domain-containing OB-fold protein [Deltaproteobacteria bacterium]|nr:Zn-ribbon domain-containing OB-fold protein [Deltaproteobacteria bacterium]MBW2151182.1 Zn-ribbon domain-containing OB-fold protein [Deltaproteobacteria bacterium]
MAAGKEVDDRFKKFGTVGFTAITKTNRFIEHLEQGKVTGTRCKSCGRVFFPPRADCFQCLSSTMEWFEVSGKGKLVTYSRLEYAPAGFDADVPYCIALLDYGDYKVFGRIAADIPEHELKAGLEMETKAMMLPGGRLTYVFEKVETDHQ